MTLSWDPDDERVVIEVFPYSEAAVVAPDQVDEDFEEPEPDELLLVRLQRRGRPLLRQARRAGRRGRAARAAPSAATRSTPRATSASAPTGSAPRPVTAVRRRRAGPPRPDHAGLQRHLRGRGRRRPRRLQAGGGGAAAVGLPRRHAWPTARWRRTSSPRRSAGTSCRSRSSARARTASAWCSCGGSPTPQQEAVTVVPEGAVPAGLPATSSTASTSTTSRSRWSTRTPARCGGWRSSTCWSTTPTARAATSWRWPTATGTASTTASRFHPDPKLRTVLWGWAGEPLADDELAGVDRLLAALGGRARRGAGAAARRRRADAAAAPLRAAARRRGRSRVPARVTGRPSRGRRSETARPDTLPACVRGPPRSCPGLAVTGPPVRLHDTASGDSVDVTPADGPARLYVCGITPYDATHLGHAATYIGFDLLIRAWRNAGHDVTYVQNVTDVDDPLLERADKVGGDWASSPSARPSCSARTWRRCASSRPTTTSGRSSRSRW